MHEEPSVLISAYMYPSVQAFITPYSANSLQGHSKKRVITAASYYNNYVFE